MDYGTPCDDRDGCTQGDACQAGACTPACGGGRATCQAGGVCDPATGTCTSGGSGGPTFVCDDEDLCTDDACDVGIGCVHTPVPCFDISGKTTLKGVNGIRDVPRAQHFAGTLVLREDGTYRLSSTGITSCGPELPDEVGMARARGHKQRVLEPANLDAMMSAASGCIGYRVSVKSYRTSVRLIRGGERLSGTSRLNASLDVLGQPLGIRGTAQWSGSRRRTPDSP